MRVAIIGGGAAGMMAAWSLSQNHPEAEIVLFEKNKGLGAKVIISGGGRCNLTTGIEDVSVVLKKYPRGSRFLKHAMYAMDPKMVRQFFEDLGVATKCEPDMRVFPVSDDGADVVAAFENYFDSMDVDVDVKLATQIIKVEKVGSEFLLYKKNDQVGKFDKLIITTGGQAYRHTGSTGDGYSFAESLGHSVTRLGPSLNSFVIDDSLLKDLSGVSLKNVVLKACCAEKKKHIENGPILITHKGLTGPVVFAMSANLSFCEFDADKPWSLFVDFVCDYSLSELEQEYLKFLANSPKKFFKHFLHQFLPRSIGEYLAVKFEFDLNLPLDALSKKSVLIFLEKIKNSELKLIARGKGDEFVTAGGVDRKEIDSKTMQSKLTTGLYFAGEIMDVDGVTGGFNLQASWAAGNLAGFLL